MGVVCWPGISCLRQIRANERTGFATLDWGQESARPWPFFPCYEAASHCVVEMRRHSFRRREAWVVMSLVAMGGSRRSVLMCHHGARHGPASSTAVFCGGGLASWLWHVGRRVWRSFGGVFRPLVVACLGCIPCAGWAGCLLCFAVLPWRVCLFSFSPTVGQWGATWSEGSKCSKPVLRGRWNHAKCRRRDSLLQPFVRQQWAA